MCEHIVDILGHKNYEIYIYILKHVFGLMYSAGRHSAGRHSFHNNLWISSEQHS